MNVFMGYNPTAAKQVKVSVWVKEIDGAEPILPATPKDGDCFIVFDTDDDVLADNPSSKKSYANGSWGDAGGGGGSGVVIPEVTVTMTSIMGGTYTSTVPFDQICDMADRYANARCPMIIINGGELYGVTAAYYERGTGQGRYLEAINGQMAYQLREDGTVVTAPSNTSG